MKNHYNPTACEACIYNNYCLAPTDAGCSCVQLPEEDV